MEELQYKSPYEDEPIKMELQVSQYLNSGAIYLGLICEMDGFPEPYGDVTVNLGTVPDYCGFLDVNNMEGIKEFVEDVLWRLKRQVVFVAILYMSLTKKN